MNVKLNFVLGIFLLLSLSVVSASSFTKTTDLPAPVSAGSTYIVSVTYSNTENDSVNLGFIGSGSGMSLPSNSTLGGTSSSTYSLSLTVPSNTLGTYSRDLTVVAKNATSGVIVNTQTVTFSAIIDAETFCEMEGVSEKGDLELASVQIDNSGEGDDDTWNYLDHIEIEVDVENTHSDDSVKDVRVVLKIVDSDGNDVTNDFDLDDEEIKLGSIREDDIETATFVIDAVPIDIEQDDYYVYVRAYSDDDESNQCISEGDDLGDYGDNEVYAEVSVDSEYDQGIIAGVSTSDFIATCGQENVELTFDVYNVGDDEEESVLVTVYNSALDIYEKVVIDDFRSGKKKTVSFFFDIPVDAAEKTHVLQIDTYFDYDDDDDSDEFDPLDYGQNSEEDMDVIYEVLAQISDCAVVSNSPVVSAQLVSDDVAVGREVTVKVNVANTNDVVSTYSLSADGVSAWAESVFFQPSSISVAGHDNSDVYLKFTPTESGVHVFSVVVNGPNGLTRQDISLSVEEGSLFSSWSLAADDYTNWIIAGLVILIIFVFLLILIVLLKRR